MGCGRLSCNGGVHGDGGLRQRGSEREVFGAAVIKIAPSLRFEERFEKS